MKTYLGDSVYLDNEEEGNWRIYTDNGDGMRNVIWLEPEVIQAFLETLERVKLYGSA